MGKQYTDEEIKRMIIQKRRAKKRKRLTILCSIVVVLALVLSVNLGIFIGNKSYANDIATYSVDDDNPLVKTAVPEATTANKSGKKFWSWYGYKSYVPWCATFVSWCADKNGLIKDGSILKYADCLSAVRWLKSKNKWVDGGATPKGGDIIFFDWDEDGGADHTGIVTGVVDDKVFTIEGNSSDRCRRKRYNIDSPAIFGYGVIYENNEE